MVVDETSKAFRDKNREVKAIEKDIETARGIIRSGIHNYKKKKLRARNKKQIEDLSHFDELNEYETQEDIHDAYGWATISDDRMHYLLDLWEARETYVNEKGKFSDRVTEILQYAVDHCNDKFINILDDFDELKRQQRADRKEQ